MINDVENEWKIVTLSFILLLPNALRHHSKISWRGYVIYIFFGRNHMFLYPSFLCCNTLVILFIAF